LVKNELKEQNLVKALEIENLDPTAYIQLPYWEWQKKLTEITNILVSNASSEEDGLLFTFPLIKSYLKQCRCVVSAKEIEIAPHAIPLQVIPSLGAASRTVFMTATLSNNSILSSHFGLKQCDFKTDIVPESAGDVGDRMILVPQVLNPTINDVEIKKYCSKRSKEFNVVIIVPSKYRAKFWSGVADQILDASNLKNGVDNLISNHVGLTVIINKYDGIDLPDNACRLLVLDGLPDVRRKIDQIDQNILSGSDREITLAIQKIEQGMGRGVRSNDDYCAIFLMGGVLTSKLYSSEALDNFSPATKAQMELSTDVSKQVKISTIDEITEVLDMFLQRNGEWLKVSKGTLASIKYSKESEIDNYTLALREAFDQATLNRFTNAVDIVSDLINTQKTDKVRGYLKQICAEYINCYDPLEAQKMQISAVNDNSRVLKPVAGIEYHKIKHSFEQASQCMNFLAKRKFDANRIILEINAILDDLAFKPKSANRFEEAIKKIALFIGFEAQRPENDYKKGPDDLWSMGDLSYLVIECKNEATTTTISKHYCNQLNGSIEWFENTYDRTCNFTPILVHPSSVFEHASSPNTDIRVIDQVCLDKLKGSISDFFKAICTNNNLRDVDIIQQQLTQHKLRRIDIVKNYTVGHSVK
ncbi:MAG: helicase C-terminal domain-containing protein, partial [Pseudomonadota bacterium]|nr:helicase C-terminal domain-containing protein [Pseudomonadota bacterium]